VVLAILSLTGRPRCRDSSPAGRALGIWQRSAGRSTSQECDTASRASMFCTVLTCHWPPRAVGMPRAFGASAIARCVVAPAAWIFRTTDNTFAANASAAVRFAAAPFCLRIAQIGRVAQFGALHLLRCARGVRDGSAACRRKRHIGALRALAGGLDSSPQPAGSSGGGRYSGLPFAVPFRASRLLADGQLVPHGNVWGLCPVAMTL